MMRTIQRPLRTPSAVPSPPASRAPKGIMPKARKRMLAVTRPSIEGGQYSWRKLAAITLTTGPAMVRDEGGQLAGYVYVDTATTDIGGCSEAAWWYS